MNRQSTKSKPATARAKPSPRKQPKPKATPAPDELAAIGEELRVVAKGLERIEAYLMVAKSTLDGNPEYTDYVGVLLKYPVSTVLFRQIRSIENLAAQCDGGSPSGRDDEDDPKYDDDIGGS